MRMLLVHRFFSSQNYQSQNGGKTVSRPYAIIFAMLAAALAISISPLNAAAQFPACGAHIDSCGCVIKNSGLFVVTATTLTVSGEASCIEIRSKNATLDLADASITGPGNGSSTGAGVDILKGSSGILVEGNGASISGFKYGVENDGTDVTLEDLTVQTNDAAGVHFSRASASTISSVTAETNGGYGIWLEGSEQNSVGGSTQVSSNVLDGILIGCTPAVGTGTCKGIATGSDGNTVFNVTATSNGTGNASSGGVTVQFNSRNNSIARSSGSGNAKGDFVNRHAAGACGNNIFVSITGTTSGACF